MNRKRSKKGFVLVLLMAGAALVWTLRQTQIAVHRWPPSAAAPQGTAPAPPHAEAASPSSFPQSATSAVPDSWAVEQAYSQVEEERPGTPMRLTIPSALRHYPDRRRFLATQMAAAQEDRLEIPHDQASLCQMILRGEMVEVPALTDTLVLYRIGEDAREDPLTHWDAKANKDVPLLGSEEEWKDRDAELAGQARRGGKDGARATATRALIASYYGNAEKREALFAEHKAVATLAQSLAGMSYDLQDPAQAAAFSQRLLHFSRKEAAALIQQMAGDYHARFDRRLPVSSLVRTARYQRRLTRVNPNATHVDIPPHTTGEAFDVSYRYMPPDEQVFVMDYLARLEQEGKVETLRENRGHVHTYVFADGRRPADTLIASLLDDVSASHRAEAASARASRTSHGTTRTRATKASKSTR